MKKEDFVHLHLHDHYSVLDGLGTAEGYCKQAKELGFSTLALTNHGNVDGCITFQRVCDQYGIKPIFGMEAYIVDDLRKDEKYFDELNKKSLQNHLDSGKPRKEFKKIKERRRHITLLAQNLTGWRNILKMLTVANLEGFYARPRIDPDLLLDHCEGLAIGSACTSTYITWENNKGISLAKKLSDKGALIYLEVMPIDLDEQRSINVELCNISDKYGWPLVATNDCHYVLREHSETHEVLLAIQSKRTWNDPNRWRFTIDTLYLQSIEDMEHHFRIYSGIEEKYWRKAMENTKIIADSCQLKLEKIDVTLPDVYIEKYPNNTPDEQLMLLTLDGFDEIKKKHDWITKEKEQLYLERIEEEIGIICGLGFANYFLIVWELINWCKTEDLKGPYTEFEGPIECGAGRGSVGGSLVALCLGITRGIDPLKYELVFARFISEARIDLPDIDMDFEDRRREDVIQHLKDLYGEYNVIGVSNFMKMKGKSALRNVARVFDIPNAEVDRASKAIITRSGGDMRADFSLEDSFETIEDGRRFKAKYPEVAKIAMELEGLIMGHSRHAAGICVSKEDLRNGKYCAYANRKGKFACNWEKNDSEYNGLMKLDILGLNALTILNETKRLVKKNTGDEIDYDTLPLDDKKVLSEFNEGNCVGVFQFNGNSIMRFCRDIGIETFDDVVALNALHRPGTLKSGTIHNYKDRKKGLEAVPIQHPYLQQITKPTYGIMLYQEQVMRIIYECAGLGWKTTDTIRKAISKSQGETQILKFKEDFRDGCRKLSTLNDREVDELFEVMKEFGSYSFNKSHAVEYSLIAYWEMYSRVHFPLEYYVAYLSWGSDAKKDDLIQDARRLKLKIMLPDINLSEAKRWQGDKDGNLLIPFEEIKGLGPTASEVIIEERNKNGPYKNFEDFEKRINKRKVNIKIRNLLKSCYCFEEDRIGADYENDEEELDRLSQLFSFSLSNDPMYRYRKMLTRIRQKVKISPIADVVGTGDLVWGLVDKITYQIKTASADEIGYSGVYGQLKDEKRNYTMINFTKELYDQRKDDLEHSADKWIIGRVVRKKADSIMASEIYYADDLMNGDVNIPELGMAEQININNTILNEPYIINPGQGVLTEVKAQSLSGCAVCELRNECSGPVYPDHGRYNAMMIGEAPGRNEDLKKLGFVGDAGDILWFGDEYRKCIGLSEYGFTRDDFWVSNFVKCWPSAQKNPKQKHINSCSYWWRKEVKAVNPFVILAFGNTGLNAIRGDKSGIMEMSGVVEWRDELNCWAVYCLHPAAVLYHAENNVYYNKGILSFLNIFLNAGF